VRQNIIAVCNTNTEQFVLIAEVSSSSGRDAGSKNLVLGTSDSVAKWRQLDEKVFPECLFWSTPCYNTLH